MRSIVSSTAFVAMMAAAAIANSGPDAWDADGMEVYDRPQYAALIDQL